MIDNIIQAARSSMDKTIDHFKTELSKIRTGRAHPSLIDSLMVPYYGSPTAMSQVASITAENARSLLITPWEKDMIAPIEKAIMSSDLGLNPVTAGMVIRVPLPPLTEERRLALTKLVKETAERARIQARQLRRDAITQCKQLEKDKDITEDDLRRAEQSIQKETDQSIATIDTICSEKESELMSI